MATIIKGTSTPRAADGALFHLDDLGDRAKEYLEQVRHQAAEIVAQAQQEAVEIRRRAEEEGRAAALEAAETVLDEKVTRQLGSLLPALRDAIDAICRAKAEWIAHWERSAVHVAAAIAGRIVRREVERAPEITITLVKEALELASGSSEIQLRLHPDDVAALGGQISRLAEELVRLGNPQIVPDATIEKGSCRVETRFGTIDQQFAAQLARIEQELT